MLKPEDATDPQDYTAQLDEPRRSEIAELDELIRQTVPQFELYDSDGGLSYGKFHYKYASGREGDSPYIGLVSRKNYISLYVMCTKDGQYIAGEYKDRLPKANIGKSCIRFRRLEDVDLGVVRQLLQEVAAIVKNKE